MFLMFVKLCRRAVVPLVGRSVGMDVAVIGAGMSAMGIADLALIPVAGVLMDTRGRKTVGVPAFIVMALGFALLGVLEELVEATGIEPAWLVVAGSVTIGVGSGLASGMNQVLGMDASPPAGPDAATFLGVWRMMSDSGALLGPVVAGAVAQRWGVQVASLCVGVVGVCGGGWLGCFVQAWRKT